MHVIRKTQWQFYLANHIVFQPRPMLISAQNLKDWGRIPAPIDAFAFDTQRQFAAAHADRRNLEAC